LLLLTTAALPQLEQHEHPNLGRLITPRHYPRLAETPATGFPWQRGSRVGTPEALWVYRLPDGQGPVR
jgi:hypothetical protein